MLTVESESKRMLLISNSTVYGSGYLDYAEKEILDVLGARARVLFIPFAPYDRDAYAATARERFAAMGFELTSLLDQRRDDET